LVPAFDELPFSGRLGPVHGVLPIDFSNQKMSGVPLEEIRNGWPSSTYTIGALGGA